jgi:phosphopantothenoylcysteine decarboxylase / phosphopantothenate---cysteine ligase
MDSKRILLIIGGGIAAYKSLELVRLLRRQGIAVRAVMTKSAAEFVTPLSLSVMTEDNVYSDLFDLKDEREIGHIQLSRQADLIVICPATANLLAKMAAGIADDLATTILLATNKPVLAVPAMNVRMWNHKATQRSLAQLRDDGIEIMPPDEGSMACGEFGPGRLPEPPDVAARICAMLGQTFDPTLASGRAPSTRPAGVLAHQPDFAPDIAQPLTGKHVIVTAGPTHEPIDPVRVLANRSSGKQGFAIAGALAALGARVTLVAGPVSLVTPAGVTRIDVETAAQMEGEVTKSLPADCAILVAAVADWRVDTAPEKLKKDAGPPALSWHKNPDILAGLAASKRRPHLLIGFAAETENVIDYATEKRTRKGCDWIIANDVSVDRMGGEENLVHVITDAGAESWNRMEKGMVAIRLAAKIADALA